MSKEIIIDEVDVSDCNYFDGDNFCKEINRKCDGYICQYKQLKHEEMEAEYDR